MQPITIHLAPRPSTPLPRRRVRGDGKASIPKTAEGSKRMVSEELGEDTDSNTNTKAPGLY